MKVYFLILTFLFSSLLKAQEVKLKNDREGKSLFQSWSISRKMKKVEKILRSEEMLHVFDESLKLFNQDNLCSFKLNEVMMRKFRDLNPKFDHLEGVLYKLRELNVLDDVSLKILLKAEKTQSTYLDLPKYEDDLWLPSNQVTVSKSLDLISKAGESLSRGCLDEVYRNLYTDLFKLDKKMTSFFIEGLLVEAYEKKLIHYKTYLLLEKARISELEAESLTLKAYYSKFLSLRKNSTSSSREERSDFVTSKLRKKISRRIHLYESYSDLQILLMADLIKKFRTRLESNKVEILVYEKDEVGEIITLEPMERFRFALKILRKEMKMLSLNTYFKGISPSYIDLMTAAYETGVVSSLEIDEIAGLEEIWNPKKTFWEKARFWVQSFGSVATILIPPPFGFIPSLALVIIEATTQKKDQVDSDLGLF